jgi:proteasome lid subunit RPN8/RPN11
MPLILQAEADKTMRSHALTDFPDECCGFFYGHDTSEGRQVLLAVPVQNSKDGDKRRRFEISPFDYMKAEGFALKHNISLLGVYHSHPQHPAIPSEHDLLQAMPFFSYIILSVMDGNIDHIRSWKLNDEGTFEEESISPTLLKINL